MYVCICVYMYTHHYPIHRLTYQTPVPLPPRSTDVTFAGPDEPGMTHCICMYIYSVFICVYNHGLTYQNALSLSPRGTDVAFAGPDGQV